MAEFTARFSASSVEAFAEILDTMVGDFERATPVAVLQGAAIIQGRARSNASHRPGPNVRTGVLRRSIIVGAGDGAAAIPGSGTARTGPYRWSSTIGPTVIYGRIQELGGTILPHHMARSGSGRPGMLSWVNGGVRFYAHRVTLPARPYLAPAVPASLAAVSARFYAVWAAAIPGAS
jgi:hypothetical protein